MCLTVKYAKICRGHLKCETVKLYSDSAAIVFYYLIANRAVSFPISRDETFEVNTLNF